ncbi:MAG: ABC transporter permease [Holophagales bacterium]|nr:ABC transporter permease [Holophagales bacterium]
MLLDIRLALRSFLQHRGPSGVAVLVLAVGIGAATLVFSLVNGLLLDPLPFAEPERLVRIFGAEPERGSVRQRVPEAALTALRESVAEAGTAGGATQPLRDVAGAFNMGLAITDAERPMNPLMRRVSPGWFELLGARPQVGRVFADDEYRQGARAAILSQGLWQSLYGGDPAVVGSTLDLAYEPYTIVGVMPAGFTNPSFPQDPVLWLPMAESAAPDVGRSSLVVHGRLAESATPEQVGQAVSTVAERLVAEHPVALAGWEMRALPLHEALTEPIRPALVVLLGAVGFVLLIACGNVANLLLARALGRRREIAVRQALGAGRRHLARQLLTESLVLSLVGAALGVLASFWALGPLLRMAPSNTPVPMLESVRLEPTVLGFSLLVAFGTTLVFGLLPLAQLYRDSGGMLGAGAARSVGDRSGRRLRSSLVIVELALSMVLLAGAGLMARSLWHLQSLGLGFEPEGVIAGRLGARGPGFETPEAFEPFHRRALEELARIPGVEQVGGVEFLPMFAGGFGSSTPVSPAEGGIDDDARPRASLLATTPGYFEAYGQPLLRGRSFDPRDRADSEPVAVVSANLAQILWGEADPLDRMLWIGEGPQARQLRIVGVAGDLRGLAQAPEPPTILFLPLSQRPTSNITFFLRMGEGGGRDPAEHLATLTPSIEDAVWGVSRDAPVYNLSTLSQMVRDLDWQPRFLMQLMLAFALVALVLAVSGIYAVLAYAVAERRREIGVRMAVGAARKQILHLVVGDALRLALFGVGVGVVGALAAGQLLSSQLLGIAPTDPFTHGTLALVLVLAALAASLLPALRATRVDPVDALGAE